MITVLGNKLSTSDLQYIPVVKPDKAGDRWQGISHYGLAVGIEQALLRQGIMPTKSVWSVDSTGQTLVGGLNVRFPENTGIRALNGMEYALGVRHSNNLKYSLTFAVGAQVTVCLNGLITGQFVLCRKHTTGLDLTNEIDRGVKRFVNETQLVKRCVTEMQQRSLTTRQSDHMLMDAGRMNLLPWSHIGQVQEEYKDPRHDVFRGRSAWNLYNAFTEIAKKSNPVRQIDAISKFREVVLN